MHRYIFNPVDNILYHVVGSSEITEKTDNKGRRTGWFAQLEIRIIRADNVLVGSQWKFPISSFPTQHFSPNYQRAQVISSFEGRHIPKGDEVSQERFEELKSILLSTMAAEKDA